MSKLKFAILVGMLAIARSGYAADVPVSYVKEVEVFTTEQDAAKAALALAIKASHSYEFGGAIIELSDGTFRYTEAVSQRGETDLNYRVRASGPIVAIYHTHPMHGFEGNTSAACEFSLIDLKVAKATGYNSYIAVVLDHSIRLLHAGKATLIGRVPS